MNHTPGPWIADSYYVGPESLPTLVKVNPNGPLGYEEILANARLIAAAPLMLKALQRITHPMADDEDLSFALEAIAKATGGQQ